MPFIIILTAVNLTLFIIRFSCITRKSGKALIACDWNSVNSVRYSLIIYVILYYVIFIRQLLNIFKIYYTFNITFFFIYISTNLL